MREVLYFVGATVKNPVVLHEDPDCQSQDMRAATSSDLRRSTRRCKKCASGVTKSDLIDADPEDLARL